MKCLKGPYGPLVKIFFQEIRQPDVGQRPRPPGEGGRAEGVFGDLPDDRGGIVGGALDADEGDPVGAGDSTETHACQPSVSRPRPRQAPSAGTPVESGSDANTVPLWSWSG